jgi:penicillin-binding protein 2
MAADTPRLRLGIVGIVALSLFAALVTRLWYLQVLSAPEYRLAAAANSVRTVEEPAPRGRILDRNGKVLVDNRASNIVAIDRVKFGAEIGMGTWSPESWKKLSKAAQAKDLQPLAGVLQVSTDAIGKALLDQRTSPYTPIPVATDVTEDKMVRLLEHGDDFPSVVARRVAVRTYPMGNIAPHVLGYVGEVTQSDIDSSHDALHLGDQIGKAGIEYAYDTELRGRPGEERIEVDAQGKPIRVVSRTPPKQGYDVKLTIDADVQKVAEDALKQGLDDARGRTFQDTKARLKADAGAVVVLDTEGGVRALASYPTFDLPSLADGVSVEEAKQLFSPNTGSPFVDRAISGRYAPGSTWKLVSADATLRSGIRSPATTIDDKGTYTIQGDCTRDCSRRNAGSEAWGAVNLSRALTVSSDVYFYGVGDTFWARRKQLGEDPIQRQAAQYGFGASTGIPLPEESPGLVLTPKLKAELVAKHSPLVDDDPNWRTGLNLNLAIGQGVVTVTPIQIANAYATFANGGDRYQPNVALVVQQQDGTVVREIPPRKAAHVDIPPSIHDPILIGLQGVLANEKGTAYNAFQGFPLDRWRIAGKTGTAQVPPKQDNALFVGFGPVPSPQFVVSVVMEQSGFGATSAAPVARRLFGQLSGLETAGSVQFVQPNGVGD